jgi:hypothetical protein
VITDADGWMAMEPGESVEDYVTAVVAARPPLTDAEIAMLRAVFRPVVEDDLVPHRSEAA